MRKFFIFFSFILSSYTGKTQSFYYGGVFPTIDHSGTLTNKIDYGLYYFGALPLANFNKPDVSKDAFFHLLYLEQALTYKMSYKFFLTASYLYQRANVFYDNYVNENRFYFQSKYKHSVNKINITHRLRFDGRFIHDRITNKTPFTHRLRYLIGFDAPINKKFYITAYEEAFFNTFKSAGVVYGENWAYAALGKKINEKNKIEAGILYVTWNIGSNNWFNQYYFQLTWISHLNFRKKQ
ncbi:MAG TPA: DUF2490 domain-containing protein [Bacteroidia bacterium]|jgi:hypothetical protein|nr:DUF2490 domain-containing protein [Bacteroidia bacterium]